MKQNGRVLIVDKYRVSLNSALLAEGHGLEQ